MNGISWQRIVAIGIFVAGALVAYAIGASQLATALGSGALLAFPLGRLAHRPLASDPQAIEVLRSLMYERTVRTTPPEMMSEKTAKIVLDAVEKRRDSGKVMLVLDEERRRSEPPKVG